MRLSGSSTLLCDPFLHPRGSFAVPSTYMLTQCWNRRFRSWPTVRWLSLVSGAHSNWELIMICTLSLVVHIYMMIQCPGVERGGGMTMIPMGK
jgi:hypothetical protein